MDDSLKEKYEALTRILKGYGRLAVAYSGGVDSTFLLAVAKEVLGENVTAVTLSLRSVPEEEKTEAENFCREYGIKQDFISINELEIPGFKENPPNRCYICKKAIFKEILKTAEELGISVVAEGTNADDLSDYRPGMQALSELGIESPLKVAGFSKAEIRTLSKEMGLPTWDKPSKACLSSRFVYGEIITEEKLRMAENGEKILMSLGILQCRVRIHGDNLARIEVPEDCFAILTEHRTEIVKAFQETGFAYVSMDLQGFRSGSMNEVLKTRE